jgi:hypothetical protein
MSLADVAQATRIKEQYLDALENGEYALLPGKAYVAGFLRNYATFVGLHPDDIVQEYHASRPPMSETNVKSATRVLASLQERDYRRRLLWGLAALAVVLVAAFTWKQYANQYAHASYAPPLNVTPANSGTLPSRADRQAARNGVRVELSTLAPVWVRVTVDGKKTFEGIMHTGPVGRAWSGHQSIYVATLDGSLVRARYDAKWVGRIAHRPGLVVDFVSPTSWRIAS